MTLNVQFGALADRTGYAAETTLDAKAKVEIHLDKDGKGDGRVLVATRININKEKVVEVENYGQQPVRLNDVKLEKRTRRPEQPYCRTMMAFIAISSSLIRSPLTSTVIV